MRPLPSQLADAIDALLARCAPGARGRLHYYDAASPIVAADSLDESQMYRKSRYEKGDGDDYLNIPLTREQYAQFVADLRELPKHQPKDFELEPAGRVPYYEGCLPIEEMAARGGDALRFGPDETGRGLRHPLTGMTPSTQSCSFAKRTPRARRLTWSAFRRV